LENALLDFGIAIEETMVTVDTLLEQMGHSPGLADKAGGQCISGVIGCCGREAMAVSVSPLQE
jgi:hypothetical protein